MQPSDQGANQRSSFRCPVAESKLAELWIGPRRIPVQLHDQSAGGFGVTATEVPDVDRGNVIQLQLDSGVFDVCLVHACENGASDQGCQDNSYRLGLQRLGEVFPPPQAAPPYRGLFWNVLRWLLPSGHMPTSLSGIVLAVVVVVAPLTFGALFFHFRHTTPGTPSDAPARIAESVVSSAAPSPRESRGEQRVATAPANPKAAPAETSSRALAWTTIARLQGAAPFLTPTVIRELGLNEDQQRRIHEIVRETEAALEQFGAQFRGVSRQERSRVEGGLLDAAREKAVGLFTVEQRQRLQAAMVESGDPDAGSNERR